ncbi:MAG: hypothetical protein NTV80_26105 [Verrucomicrobia bacterium]|nr:hypothetical protein [Verrucomicrobiota bacterium]
MAAQFVLTVVGLNGAAAAMGSMGASCLVAAKAGVALVSGLVSGSAFGGGLLAKMVGGAALGAIYNGAQTAINGGSFSDILKSAAIGAATGAVGAAVGGLLHGIPGNVAGALGKAVGKTAAGVAGKIVHYAAHGVAGGLMSMAMGGTFQDGLIGSAIGAGVSAVTGAVFPGLDGIEGAKGVLVRTAIASISGGAASALAGGKFADGAYSAAFFHLFNHESGRLINFFSNSDYLSRETEILNLIKSHRNIMVVIGHGNPDYIWDDTALSSGEYSGPKLGASKVASMIINHPDFKSVDEVWLLGCNNGNLNDAKGGVPIAQLVSDRIHKPVVSGSAYVQVSDGHQLGLVRGKHVPGAVAQVSGNPNFVFETPRVAPAPPLYRFQPRGFFQRKPVYSVVEYNFKNKNGYGYYRY